MSLRGAGAGRAQAWEVWGWQLSDTPQAALIESDETFRTGQRFGLRPVLRFTAPTWRSAGRDGGCYDMTTKTGQKESKRSTFSGWNWKETEILARS